MNWLQRIGSALWHAPAAAPWLTGSLLGTALGTCVLLPFALAPLAQSLLVASTSVALGSLLRTLVVPARPPLGAAPRPAALPAAHAQPLSDVLSLPWATGMASGLLTGTGIVAAGLAWPVAATGGLLAATGWTLGLDAAQTYRQNLQFGTSTGGLAERALRGGAQLVVRTWHRPLLTGALVGAFTLAASLLVPAYAATLLGPRLTAAAVGGVAATLLSFLSTAETRHLARAAAGAVLAGVLSSAWLGLQGVVVGNALALGAAAAAAGAVCVYLVSSLRPATRLLLLGAMAVGLASYLVGTGVHPAVLLSELQRLATRFQEALHG